MDSVVLTFATPLRSFDPARVSLTRDSSFATVPFTALEDTSRMSASIRTPWAEGTRYNLILQKDFATDTSGRQLLKPDTLSFTTKRKSDYGSLTIRFRNTAPGPNAILQFVQNDKVVFSAPVTNGTVTAPMFIPGDYELRVLNDRNGNGKWDTGHFFGTRRQPETARSLPRKITIRPAWDNEFTL